MKNWPADLDKNCLDTHPRFLSSFGYQLEGWLERHPETPLGAAYEFAVKKHGKEGSMEETGMCMRWVDNMACEVIANTFREHVEQGLDDFEEISGKILAEYVKVRLEGGI